ncbi:AAA family ATPase [Actinophytocola sp. NPDC049390]|uniref:AAA family ATPase n=1 Tax=Actinophytocola sp. NPDC049390 TaxID=3363894 RepID=UPI00379C2987
MRVLLIGGTSNVGKSTVAAELADRLGFEHRSTDYLARHPGRPWRTADREVPPHVAEHYSSLAVDELISSVLTHYERLWPRIEELVRTADGLVIEGSALWPERVATLDVPAVWLTAGDDVIRDRIRASGGYATATVDERALMDKFLARSIRFQQLLQADVDRLGLARVDVGGRAVAEVADDVLA